MTSEVQPFVRARLLAGLLLIVVFGAGGVAGAAAHHLLGASDAVAGVPPDRPDGSDARGDRDDGRSRPASRLSERLDLTAEQSEQVREILDARRRRIGALLREVEPRIEAQRDTTGLEIRAILTPEQVRVYEQMFSSRDDSRDGRGRSPDRDGAPPAP